MATEPEAIQVAEKTGVLEAEYEHEPVPLSVRKSLPAVSLVWLGFPMILTCALIGSLVVEGLGFQRGVIAIILGNLILFAYVGALSALASRYGLNFALLASTTLGKKGYVAASALLSTIVLGWFTVQTGLTAVSLHTAFGWPLAPMAVVAGIVYVAITIVGVRALAIIGAVSAPLFLIFGAYAIYLAVAERGWGSILSYHVAPGKAIPFALGLTLVVSSFIDSGTMTADFTRWAKNPLHAIIATFSAFPFANAVAMLMGAVVAGTGAKTASVDFFGLVANKGGIIAVLAVIFLFANLGSVCTHCLYNSAVGWSHILRGDMRRASLVLGTAGTIVAAIGVWSFFTNWLNFLGVVIPPIGGVLIADHFIVHRAVTEKLDLRRLPDFQAAPFVAWAVAGVTAVFINYNVPSIPVVLWGMVVAMVVYPIVAKFMPYGILEEAPEWR